MSRMRVNDNDVQELLYCATELLERRRVAGVPIPEWMRRLAGRLDLAAAVSADGHENTGGNTGSGCEDLIDSAQAAQMLGVSARHLRRLHADLDGQKVGNRWLFKASTVYEYRTAKEGLEQ